MERLPEGARIETGPGGLERLIRYRESKRRRQRLATIGKFASQIAHEIRNPLSSISLNVELLEDEWAAADYPLRRVAVLLDNSQTFGGTHYAEPRQIYVQLRYRFRIESRIHP
jgi:signal transduction histidine kinase